MKWPDDYDTIASIEWRYESWEYDQTEVYRRNDGALFYAEDSGCSCPMPFEFTTEADLTPIRSVADWNRYARGSLGDSGSPDLTRRDIAEATATIRKYLTTPAENPTPQENTHG